jgi:hypothetical protein
VNKTKLIFYTLRGKKWKDEELFYSDYKSVPENKRKMFEKFKECMQVGWSGIGRCLFGLRHSVALLPDSAKEIEATQGLGPEQKKRFLARCLRNSRSTCWVAVQEVRVLVHPA